MRIRFQNFYVHFLQNGNGISEISNSTSLPMLKITHFLCLPWLFSHYLWHIADLFLFSHGLWPPASLNDPHCGNFLFLTLLGDLFRPSSSVHQWYILLGVAHGYYEICSGTIRLCVLQTHELIIHSLFFPLRIFFVHLPRRHRCWWWGPVGWQWGSRTSTFWPVRLRSTFGKSLQLFLTILEELGTGLWLYQWTIQRCVWLH